jgi:hypothetical protein
MWLAEDLAVDSSVASETHDLAALEALEAALCGWKEKKKKKKEGRKLIRVKEHEAGKWDFHFFLIILN